MDEDDPVYEFAVLAELASRDGNDFTMLANVGNDPTKVANEKLLMSTEECESEDFKEKAIARAMEWRDLTISDIPDEMFLVLPMPAFEERNVIWHPNEKLSKYQ